jgi:ribonuclease HI/exonuclease III
MRLNHTEKETTLGRPGSRDGDNGAMVAPATVCPEASSLNRMKSPGSGVLQSVQPSPIQHENHQDRLLTGIQNQVLSGENPQIRTDNDRDTEQNKSAKRRIKLGTKQGITLATFNIHGKKDALGASKYKRLSTLVRKYQIAIMALQETRLNDIETERLSRENPRISIISNGNNTNKEGVGFLLNLDLIKAEEYTHTILIQNRASRLQIKWHETVLDLVVIYAPNQTLEKIQFFENLLTKMITIKDWNEPILMGDFNFVEQGIDRWPEHPDDNRITETFKRIKKKFKAIDGWRLQNPNTKDFTFNQQATGSKSRIDRIYMHQQMYPYAVNWDVISSAKISDHDISYVQILRKGLPHMGKGLWALRPDMIEYKPFYEKAKKVLLQAQEEITKTEENPNPQQIWFETKQKIQQIAVVESRERNNRKRKQMKGLTLLLKNLIEENKQMLIQAQRVETEQKIQRIKNKIASIEEQRLDAIKEQAEATYAKLGETGSRYWYNLNKTKKPSTIILALKNKKGRIEKETRGMVEVATNYHKELQAKPAWSEERKAATDKLLKKVNERLCHEDKEFIQTTIEKEEIQRALKKASNGKAPGPDGIPYEFYKAWLNKYSEDVPDILEILYTVYKHQEENGIQVSEFTEGSMCLVYKKKDKTKIENYRPITLLNTDYKILTKVIATRLGMIAPRIIHKNQAGFIPGRGIYDHTKLSHLVTEYCELENINGCIMALDQEKAYDKIDHEYLWKVLETYGFPKNFIKRVQNIYQYGKTAVMVNGTQGKPIEINRGVRQGDPMSCLIYDIAIEPLANMLRKSKLKGIKVPGTTERILVSLFADDTLVYLRQKDDLNILKNVVELFCTASTAKFNIEKTEILPIGNPKFREKMINEKRMGRNEIEPDLKIIKEGEAMRTLGAWVGNELNDDHLWEKILDTQRTIMERWDSMHPSLKGRELILKALIQSKALFLATVNGMTIETINKMKKQMKDFLWGYKHRGLMKWETVILPKNEGGLNIPDIEARIEAIQVVWLKKWLDPSKTKPVWTYLMDHIIQRNVTAKPLIENTSKMNWILQSWHESMAKDSKISRNIRQILRVARKYNAGMTGPKLSLQTKKEMPAWHHFAITNNYLWNKKASRCLRNNHNIMTIGDLINEKRKLDYGRERPGCKHNKQCYEMAVRIIGELPEKFSPMMSTPAKDRLDHTPRRKEVNKNINIREDPAVFNPDITEKGNPLEAIRIFVKRKTYKKRRFKDYELGIPAYRARGLTAESRKQELVLYTDGAAINNGWKNGRVGLGVWHKEGSRHNKSLKVTYGSMTNQRAELLAIIEAIHSKDDRKIQIISDSETSLKGILERAKSWEDRNWLGVQNKNEWEYLLYILRKRTATTRFKWIKGHAGLDGNEQADKLAGEGISSEQVFSRNMTIAKEFRIEGARLQALNQATAYGLIIEWNKQKKSNELTNRTKAALEDASDEIQRTTGLRPEESMIWESLRSKDIENKIGDFIWKVTHGRIKCGKFFKHVPGMEEKQYCECGEIESIDHILIYCDRHKAKELWKEINKIWTQTTEEQWPTVSPGIIRGLGTVKFRDKDGKDQLEKEKLYKILVSTTIWTVWKERNTRRIEQPQFRADLQKTWAENLRKKIKCEFNKIKLLNYAKRKKALDDFEKTWCKKGVFAQLMGDKRLLRVNM